jgi:hypothetical protein
MKGILKTTGIMMLGAAVLFTGCKKDKDEKFTVTATANNPEWGVVVGGGEFDEGTEIVLAATANEGYHFVKWSNELTDNPLKLVVTKNESLIAYFAEGNGGNGGNGSGDPQSITLSGTINENTTWKDLGLPVDYIVDGTIYLEGNALVTVDSGVTIMFTGVDGAIEVGENAGFKIAGTANKPVVFTGPTNNQNKGAWGYIDVNSKRADNVWEYATFKNGGSDSGEWGCVIGNHGKLSMKNCTIDGSLSSGIALIDDGAFTAFEGNTITNCTNYPLFIEHQNSYFCLNANNNFVANGKNMIALRNFDWSIDNSNKSTLVKMAVPYCLLGWLRLEGSQTFTIEAGTNIKLTADAGISIDENVTFIAEGTADSHIEISGTENEKSHWENIWYGSKKSASSIKYVDFKNGGKGDDNAAILSIANGSKLTMANCSFSETEGAGISFGNVNEISGINITGDTYTNCGSKVLVIEEYTKEGDEDPTITAGQTFDNFAALKAAMQ